jgi:starch synthase (maltosyl-transferring)
MERDRRRLRGGVPPWSDPEIIHQPKVVEMNDKEQANIIIECIGPAVNGGRHPVKREVGESLQASADIFKEGHDVLGAALLYRCADESDWREAPMQPTGNDRWVGSFTLDRVTTWLYTVTAWVERFDTWRRDTLRKKEAAHDIASELLEGRNIFSDLVENGTAADDDRRAARVISATLQRAAPDQLMAVLLADETAALATRFRDSRLAATHPHPFAVICDRVRARFGAWYEMFARSQGTDPTRSATFAECEARLDDIQRLGFDVVYLPPIHPIGNTKRKGPNNSLTAGPRDPGSPYAIGSEAGGHCAVEPSLGTLADFDHFVAATRARGMEVALDFAINCSPDHPYVKQHPEWFFHRPDGSIKYAENPPKRYEDIYPLNFYSAARRGLWEEMKHIIEFWIGHGVHIFRVDNPHTKPMPFWEWLLGGVRRQHPEVIFLSEAFTRPKVMKYLAKIGFQQSYTYFTWRNTKQELTDYLRELADGPSREYFRPNFFTNTPDILPEILQKGGRPAFQTRFVLAATLSPSYGIYNGFELCENRAIPGTEEYDHSEKYEFKVWDWDRAGNIKDLIAKVNALRRSHPALQRIGVRFLPAHSDQVLLYAKMNADRSDVLLIAVNLDPWNAHESGIELPLEEFGIGDDQPFEVKEEIHGTVAVWKGRQQHLRLDPNWNPALIFTLRG